MPHRMKVNLLGMAHKVLYWDFIHLFLSPSHTFCVLMVCVQKWVLLVYTPHPWVSSQKSSWCPHSTQNVLCKPSICIPTPVSQLWLWENFSLFPFCFPHVCSWEIFYFFRIIIRIKNCIDGMELYKWYKLYKSFINSKHCGKACLTAENSRGCNLLRVLEPCLLQGPYICLFFTFNTYKMRTRNLFKHNSNAS